jgi:sugar phosphate isomerase/epimerase
MTRIAIGTWAFGIYAERPRPFNEVLDRISSQGFDGVEFGAFAPHPDPVGCATPEDLAALRDLFASKSLEISAVAADFGTSGFIRTDEPEEYLREIDRNLAFCEAIGAPRLIVNAVDPPGAPYEVGYELALERLVGTWQECARRAHEKGLTLAWEFEPCWAFNEPDQIVEIAHRLAGPGFGVLYDTAHAHAVSVVGARQRDGAKLPHGGQTEFLEQLAGTITHVHLLDSDGRLHDTEGTTLHVPFGHGHIDFDRVIPALIEAGGATEWWCVDLCFWPNAWEASAESLSFARSLLRAFLPEAGSVSTASVDE